MIAESTPQIEYLVQYGTLAFVGRFSSSDNLDRGESVIVRSPRGIEPGTVLSKANRPLEFVLGADHSCEFVRRTESSDREALQQLQLRLHSLVAEAESMLQSMALPVSLIDAEWLLEDPRVILHLLPWQDTDVTPFTSQLAQKYTLDVRVYDLRQSPAAEPRNESQGCGKPGCGSSSGGCGTGGCGTGGGCGTSSCARGSIKSADELTGYFVQLREKMEQQSSRRTALH